jgi:hypothetical protein
MALGINLRPDVFVIFLPELRLYVVKNMCIYTHVHGCVEIVYELSLLPNNTASVTFLQES